MEQSSTIPKRVLISHRRLTLIANICWNIVYYLTNRYLNRNNACTSIFLRMWKTLFWKRGFGMRPNTDYFIYLFVFIESKGFSTRFRRSSQRKRIDDRTNIIPRSIYLGHTHTHHPRHGLYLQFILYQLSRYQKIVLYESIQRLNL